MSENEKWDHLLPEAVSLRLAAEGRERQARDEVERLREHLRIARAERDREAHSAKKAERERDAAEYAEAEMERERDEWEEKYLDTDEALHRTRRERDEAVARAEAAEARLADPYSQANQKAAAWDRVAAHPALRMDLLPEADHTYAGMVFERITWLAETAEARPAVTRQAVRDALAHGHPVDAQAVEGSILASVDEDSRLLAAHALWQEAHDVDQ